jgi:hypothetical protein
MQNSATFLGAESSQYLDGQWPIAALIFGGDREDLRGDRDGAVLAMREHIETVRETHVTIRIRFDLAAHSR